MPATDASRTAQNWRGHAANCTEQVWQNASATQTRLRCGYFTGLPIHHVMPLLSMTPALRCP